MTESRAFVTGIAVFLLACGDRGVGGDASPITGAVLDSVIASRITVEEDRTLFTLFAMLNAAGYDEENYVEMHPVRRSVRGALPRLLPDPVFAQLEAFYAQARGQLVTFAIYAKGTSGAPDFVPPPGHADSHHALSDLPLLLRTFHGAFPVDSVYRSHQTSHLAYIADFRSLIRQKASLVFAYARVRDTSELSGFGEYNRVKIIPSLLLAYLRGFVFDLADGVHYRVEGPMRSPVYDPHDFVLAVTRPISYDTARHGAVQQRAAPVFARFLSSGRSSSLAWHVNDDLAHAISLRLASLTSAADSTAIRTTHSRGELVPYFYEQLKAFERQRAPLREYYPRLFENLPAWLDSTRAAKGQQPE